jgi:transposase
MKNDTYSRGVSGDGIEMPSGNVISLESGRIAWIRHYRHAGNVKEVCERFRISKKTFYKWLKRFKESGGDMNSLADRSRRPHRFPNSTPEAVVLLLRQARTETGFGQRRLKAYMARTHNITISERTIWKILKKFEDQSQNNNQRYY